MWYITQWCFVWWPNGLLKESYFDQFCGVNMGKMFGGHHFIISSMYGWRKVVCYQIIPLVVAQKPIEGGWPWWLFLVKMEKNLEGIGLEGQGHIFTFDLIFAGSSCHIEGSCVLWMVFYLVKNGVILLNLIVISPINFTLILHLICEVRLQISFKGISWLIPNIVNLKWWIYIYDKTGRHCAATMPIHQFKFKLFYALYCFTNPNINIRIIIW